MPELKGKMIIASMIAVLLFMPTITSSDAKLWDLQIQADVENSVIFPEDRPIIIGVITDHASDPVKDVQINIRSGPDYMFTTSDENGQFKVKFHSSNWNPGYHTVTIAANTIDGKTGMMNISFQVQGEQKISSVTEQKLSTPEAAKYLNAKPEDFGKDPIGLRLYYYYQDLYLQYIEEKKHDETLVNQKEKFIQLQLEEERLKRIAVDEYNPQGGTLSEKQIEEIIDSADESIQETISEQLDYTVNIYEEANKAKELVLSNGGTMEEAMTEYYAKLAISTETMEQVISGELEAETEEVAAETEEVAAETEEVAAETEEVAAETEEVAAETEEVAAETEEVTDIIVTLNGKEIKIKSNVTSLYVNEDGKLVKYLVQGTELVRAE